MKRCMICESSPTVCTIENIEAGVVTVSIACSGCVAIPVVATGRCAKDARQLAQAAWYEMNKIKGRA